MDLSTRPGRREQGQRIQQAVERAGLSIEELAGRIGCSRALIYQYLSGSTLAQPDRLQQIAVECGVPLTFFYADAPPEPAALAPSETPSTPVAPAVEALLPPAPTPQEVAARLNDSLRSLQELAEAQEGPPDLRALASTCERIVSLAAQLGDRQALARAQRRLGTARLNLGEYPRAAEALSQAVALAIEASDAESEMAARQSLGAALLMMGRAAEAREQFLLTATSALLRNRWRGTLALGGLHEMHGEYARAMQRIDEAATLLEEGEARGEISASELALGRLYVNTNRTNVYMNGGDFAEARALAERRLQEAELIGNADQSLEARFDIAWCHFFTGRWAQAHEGFALMLQLARFAGDQGRETIARAWLGIFHAASGDFDAAIAQGKDALALALSRGDRRAELDAQLALADAYINITQRDSEARYHTNQALAVTTALRLQRGEIDCRLRLARLNAQANDLTELRDAATRALTRAQQLGARHLESLARVWMAETWKRAALLPTDPSGPDALAMALEETERALQLAQETDCFEGLWRSHAMRAQLLQARTPEDMISAEGELRQAVELLDRARASLREAGLADTLLENVECADLYAQLARLLRRSGRDSEAAMFLEQVGWPPLTALAESEEAVE